MGILRACLKNIPAAVGCGFRWLRQRQKWGFTVARLRFQTHSPVGPLNPVQDMQNLIKFLKKPAREQALYLEVTFWLGISRLAILMVPFRWVAPCLGTHMASSDENDAAAGHEAVRSVSRAIRTMSRHLPWECKCLAQAISGKMMLRRKQIPSTLYLGVAKKEDGDLNAHAWLCAGDIILLGGGRP